MRIDFTKFFPERLSYEPVSSSARGDRTTFERIPTGMSTRKVVDYYTSWTKKPGEDDPRAKFLADVVRGDLYLTLAADLLSQKRVNINNDFFQTKGTLRLDYDATDRWRIFLEDVYYERDFRAESDTYFLYDHVSNKFSLGGRYNAGEHLTYLMTFSDEFFDHLKQTDQDYRVDTLTWETYYNKGRSTAGLLLQGVRTRYGRPRLYYADSDQLQAILTYVYPMTPTFFFHFKDEWLDVDYDTFEDELFSSYVRNTWRIALQKKLSSSQSCEIGYQGNREKHRLFSVNNIVEKTLFVSWLSNY